MIGRQCSEAHWGEQLLGDNVDDGWPSLFVEDGMVEGDREDLMRPAGRVVAGLAIDDIEQAAGRRMQEAAIERSRRASGLVIPTICAGAAFDFGEPFRQKTQRVVPERVDLDGLASSGCDYPVAYLRIHPR